MVQKAGLRILNSFRKDNLRTFVDLCKEAGYPTDLGGYYLRLLVRADYLSKGERGEYILTAKGRRYLTSEKLNGTSPRVLVLVIASIGGELVVLERHKQPFLKRKEWPASAVRGGEAAQTAAKRLLDERLSNTDDIQFKGIFRRIDFYENELFDDKVFLVHEALLHDNHRIEVSTGHNLRVKHNDLGGIKHASRSLNDIFQFAQSDGQFTEKTYQLDYEDFEPEVKKP